MPTSLRISISRKTEALLLLRGTLKAPHKKPYKIGGDSELSSVESISFVGKQGVAHVEVSVAVASYGAKPPAVRHPEGAVDLVLSPHVHVRSHLKSSTNH